MVSPRLILVLGLSLSALASAQLPAAGTGEDAWRYLQVFVSQGQHRSGDAGDAALGDYMREEFQRLGLETAEQFYEFNRFSWQRAELQVTGRDFTVLPFYYSGLTSNAGIEAELVYVGEGRMADFARLDVAGKIVLADIPVFQNFVAPSIADVRARAFSGGAVGLVLSIDGPENRIPGQNAMLETGLCHLPTLLVGREDGVALAALDGQSAELVLAGDYEGGQRFRESTTASIGITRNSIGFIRGSSDDVIVIPQTKTCWFSCAAERGGPFGLQMTLARYYAERYRDEPPPQTLLFVGNSGHEIGRLGIRQFLASNADWLPQVTAFVHAGDAVTAFNDQEINGRVQRLPGEYENRFLFISENAPLQEIVQRAFAANGIALPLLPLTAANFGNQAETHAAGSPTVAITGANVWFHTDGDQPSTLSAELLDPYARAYIQIIDELLVADPEAIRAAQSLPPRAAVPATCPGEDLPAEDPFSSPGAQFEPVQPLFAGAGGADDVGQMPTENRASGGSGCVGSPAQAASGLASPASVDASLFLLLAWLLWRCRSLVRRRSPDLNLPH